MIVYDSTGLIGLIYIRRASASGIINRGGLGAVIIE